MKLNKLNTLNLLLFDFSCFGSGRRPPRLPLVYCTINNYMLLEKGNMPDK